MFLNNNYWYYCCCENQIIVAINVAHDNDVAHVYDLGNVVKIVYAAFFLIFFLNFHDLYLFCYY